MKYLMGIAALVVIAGGYFLVSSDGPSAPGRDGGVSATKASAPAPVPPAPAAPVPASGTPAPRVPAAAEAVASTETTPPDQDLLLEDMAADTRENLPSTVMDTLAMTDAQFLPRMRIMEYTYVTTAPLARSLARDMRDLIGASAEALCLEERALFKMGATLRISFQDRDSTLFQRVYLLPEDCQQFY